jgi:hypothetical protein
MVLHFGAVRPNGSTYKGQTYSYAYSHEHNPIILHLSNIQISNACFNIGMYHIPAISQEDQRPINPSRSACPRCCCC